MTLRIIIVIWTLNSMWNIPTLYMFVDALIPLKKVQQTTYLAMNSLSQPARVSKREQEKRQFAVAAYYDYYTHVLTRQHVMLC